MPYPESSEVSAGGDILASQYNKLRSDALYPLLVDFTYGETISVNDAVYLKSSDGKVYKTSAQYSDERVSRFVGFAKEAGGSGNVKKVQVAGRVGGFSGLITGKRYFLTNTPGGIGTSAGNYVYCVGLAISTTELLIVKRGMRIMASDELKHANDDERNTPSTTYVKLKEIKVNVDFLPVIKISFDLNNGSGGYAYARIYKNESPIGTERVQGLAGWQTYVEYLGPFVKNDLIQLYARHSVGGTNYRAYVRNFRLYYSERPWEEIDFTNQDP